MGWRRTRRQQIHGWVTMTHHIFASSFITLISGLLIASPLKVPLLTVTVWAKLWIFKSSFSGSLPMSKWHSSGIFQNWPFVLVFSINGSKVDHSIGDTIRYVLNPFGSPFWRWRSLSLGLRTCPHPTKPKINLIAKSLGPVYTSCQSIWRQCCDNACDTVLIDHNGVAWEWGCNLFWS